MSFPVPRLQGDSYYKAGGLCKDVVALSLQSLKQIRATGQERLVLIVPALAAGNAGIPLWYSVGFN